MEGSGKGLRQSLAAPTLSLMCVRMWSRDQCKTLVKLKPWLPVQNQHPPPTLLPIQLSPACSPSWLGGCPHIQLISAHTCTHAVIHIWAYHFVFNLPCAVSGSVRVINWSDNVFFLCRNVSKACMLKINQFKGPVHLRSHCWLLVECSGANIFYSFTCITLPWLKKALTNIQTANQLT